jgi:hypothetical protein
MPIPAEASSPSPAIVWFRQDRRLADNAALKAAATGDVPSSLSMCSMMRLPALGRLAKPAVGCSRATSARSHHRSRELLLSNIAIES